MGRNRCRALRVQEKPYGLACLAVCFCMAAFGLLMLAPEAVLADDHKQNVINAIESITAIIGTILQVLGVIMSAYSVGQLVLAFQRDDSDSKARAASILAVGIVMIAMPTILRNLNLSGIIT